MKPAWVLLSAILCAGCQMSPRLMPRHEQHNPGISELLVRDTAVAVARQPIRSTARATVAATTRATSIAHGFFDKRLALPFLTNPPPIDDYRPTLNPDEMERFSFRLTGEPLLPADIRFYIDPDESVAALEAVIDSAKCRVDVLMYLWGPDEIGWRVARKFAAKAASGVPVRIMVDAAGNLMHGEPRNGSAADKNAAVSWLAQQPNVTLIRTRVPGLNFDHRKLTVADGRIAFSGGRNFRIESYNRDHDLDYTVTGPLAWKMAKLFDEAWRTEGGKLAPPLPEPQPAAEPNAAARMVLSDPTERAFARHIYRAVELARHHVYLHNPYFGDPHLLYLLAQARQRGVDVRVVLTLTSMNPLYDGANKATTNRLLKAGCRVYNYPAMTHVKAMTVDGVWAYTGTGNFDVLSLRQNREMGIVFGPGPALRNLEAQLFREDCRPEWELTQPLPLNFSDCMYEIIAAGFG